MSPQWEKFVERKGDFWKNYVMILSFLELKKEFGFTIEKHLTIRRRDTFVHWKNIKATNNFGKKLLKKIIIEYWPQKINKIAKNKIVKLALASKIINLLKPTQSRNTIVNNYNNFINCYLGLYPTFHLSIFTNYIEWLLTKKIKASLKNKIKTYLNIAAKIRLKSRQTFNLACKSAEHFFKLVSTLTGVNQKTLSWLTPNELTALLKYKTLPPKIILQARKQFCILYFNKTHHLLTKNEAKLFIKKLNLPKIEKTSLIKLTGTVAYPGIVTGQVKIIKKYTDKIILHKGDIMVTPMTTPDLLPLISKISAIVTDEGGLTCHAAIIAREFKKPCIIGTKLATQILKNGQKIKVNANNGTIDLI